MLLRKILINGKLHAFYSWKLSARRCYNKELSFSEKVCHILTSTNVFLYGQVFQPRIEKLLIMKKAKQKFHARAFHTRKLDNVDKRAGIALRSQPKLRIG